MPNRRTFVVWTAAVLALGAAVVAQSAGSTSRVTPAERFSYVAANAAQAGPSGEGRMQIVINQWSPDSERARLLEVLTGAGADKLTESLGRGSAVGYIHWPGHLEYTIRFAARLPRPDGGEDIILGTDYPVHVWWDAAKDTPPAAFNHGTVLQLRLNRDGRGEGKLSTGARLSVTNDGKLFAIEDYASQPVLLTDIQRDGRTT
jgi:hypothetical protein